MTIDIMGAMRATELLPMAAPAAQAAEAPRAAAMADTGDGGFARVLSQKRVAADGGGKTVDEQEPEADEIDAADGDQTGLGALAALLALHMPEDAAPETFADAGADVPAPAEDGAAVCCLADGADAIGGLADIRDAGAAAELISILEGTQADGTKNSAPAGADVDYKSADADLARMPQARMQTGTQQRISAQGDLAPAEMRDDMPCPLENADEGPARDAGDDSGRDSGRRGDDTARVWDYTLAAGAAADAAPERVAAAEQLKAAPAEQPVARENLFDAMVEKLEVMREDGVPQMTVELKPEYLGRVTLNLTAAPSGGVNLRISAADPGVKGMIDGQIAALVENLSGKGVRLERVDVVYTGVGAGSGGYDGLGQRTGNEGRRRARGGR
ncbi:MAG: flagellar hook-length control protein FliK, partial [Oscillospiraceae bacterium]|nr:flagellar hook-length control protein FliK [Oscillospiraceae bacterium]